MNLAYLVTAAPASSSQYSTTNTANKHTSVSDLSRARSQTLDSHQSQSSMATALHPNPYSSHTMGYAYQRPPSPPEDENKCSLPSISSLLQAAEAGTTTTQPCLGALADPLFLDKRQQAQQTTTQKDTSPRFQHHQRPYNHDVSKPRMSEHQRSQSLGYRQEIVSNHRVHLPPSPPQETEPRFDGREQSNSVSSSYSSASAHYGASAINNLEPYQQRSSISHAPTRSPRQTRESHGSPASYAGSYVSSAANTPSSYVSPTEIPPSSAIYYQRPLPSFTPSTMAMPLNPGGPPPSISHAPSAWQHHHYFPPSSSAGYTQTQDRYVCQTCNKAFSRPSSLRIHSHSHTGEKPFRCSHTGCGKAFSVRSNMKRHERGCHSGRSDSPNSR